MNASGQSLAELIRPNGVSPVWCDGREILRRIFVTVRDRHWREIAPTQWESAVDEERRTATLAAQHISDSVGFEWQGKLQVGRSLRHLQFQMTGHVLRDMEVCRLGLVVLHSVESMVGSQLVAVGPHDSQSLSVRQTIAPQPVVDGIPGAMTEPFSRLVVERSDFGRLELQFEGDLFEIEDQRNWGDASFKSYCTPLRLGFPRALKAGTSIVQSVEMRFVPAASRVTEVEERGAKATGVFPRIGCDWAPSSAADVQSAGQLEIPWSHLHFDIEGPQDLRRLRALLSSLPSTKIELGVDMAGDVPSQDMLGLLSERRNQIFRLILRDSHSALPSNTAIERWHRQLRTQIAGTDVPIFIGTRGYFVEFNRNIRLGLVGRGIAFPLTATVHSDDAETIRDNVTAIRDMADTARLYLNAFEVVVQPLALYHPRFIAEGNFSGELIEPWLAATLINAALTRVDSVTISQDVIEMLGSRGAQALNFISRLVTLGGQQVLPLSGSIPLGVHASVIRASSADRGCILAANLTSEPVVISLPDPAKVEIPAFGVSWTG